jgi:hypothetical protein
MLETPKSLLVTKILFTSEIRAFWDIAPCSLIGVDRSFRGAYCLHHQGATFHKVLIFIIVAVRTCNLTYVQLLLILLGECPAVRHVCDNWSDKGFVQLSFSFSAFSQKIYRLAFSGIGSNILPGAATLIHIFMDNFESPTGRCQESPVTCSSQYPSMLDIKL